MKALVVDDSRTMRRLLAAYLSPYSMEIVEAGDGLEALDQLDRGSLPDVVIIDWDMPRMSGLEFIKAVRLSPKYTAIKIIMVSWYNKLEDIAHALATGATDFLMKPMSEEMLHAKLVGIGVLK
jgi:two-component system, chemotaxis family, chemotaxis protein CheY